MAEGVFRERVAAEPRIRLLIGRGIAEVGAGKRVVSLRVVEKDAGQREGVTGESVHRRELRRGPGGVCGGATGWGRESRSEYNELHAGVVYQDYETRTLLPGSTGEGDGRIQTYTFRLCVTSDAANSALTTAPPRDYDRRRNVGCFDNGKAGPLDRPRQMKEGLGYYEPTFGTLVRALSLAELPNGKFDVNMNSRPLGFPFAEINYGYPGGTWAMRVPLLMGDGRGWVGTEETKVTPGSGKETVEMILERPGRWVRKRE